jgi:hypothetical protein
VQGFEKEKPITLCLSETAREKPSNLVIFSSVASLVVFSFFFA